MSVIDEMGLAELSPHNPLKVLHPFLDKPLMSFVGISNWVYFNLKQKHFIESRCLQNESNASSQTSQT